MKKLCLLLLTVILTLCTAACSNSSVENTVKELGDTVASAVDSNNKYVLMVKNGYRENNPNLTYDKAFSAFFGTPRWKYFKGDKGGEDVVEFTGDCTYQDTPVKARIQFVVDEKNGTFKATYLAFNEVPQNMLILGTLIEKAFASALEQAPPKTPAKNNTSAVNASQTDMKKVSSEEIIYKGKTITNWLGARPRQKPLQDEFGAPLNTGKARGGDYRRYDGITLFINVQRDEIVSIAGTNLALFTVHGVTLNKDRAGLVRIFGNPKKEGQVVGGDDEGSYYMAYDYMGYALVFYKSNPNGKAESFEISNKKE